MHMLHPGQHEMWKLWFMLRKALTLIEPLHRQGLISRPSWGSSPSKHMRHCFASSAVPVPVSESAMVLPASGTIVSLSLRPEEGGTEGMEVA